MSAHVWQRIVVYSLLVLLDNQETNCCEQPMHLSSAYRRRKKDFVNDYFMICALEDAAWQKAQWPMYLAT